jgi:oligopeptide transport system substrate-binding protein
VPREYVEEMGTEWLTDAGEMGGGWQTPGNLLTSGPFFLVAYDAEIPRVILQRNPAWPIDRGGNVDQVTLLFLDDEMAAYTLWQERTLDVVPLPAAERRAFLQRSPEKATLITGQTLFYLGFNFESQVFREPEMRRAFSAAVDRERLVEDLLGGEALAMRHFTPPGIFGAPPANEVGIGYSPDYARQQLSDSTIRNCRLMPPVTFLVSSLDRSLRQAELLRDIWVEELGCPEENIAIEQVQFGALLANTRAEAGGARPDMWELAWAPYFPDAHNLLADLLHCQDGDNRQQRQCSEVDTLMRRAGSSVDPAERQGMYREIENLFFGDNGLYPLAPLYVQADAKIVQSWLRFTPALFGGEQYDTYVVDNATKELERSR